MSRAVVRDRPAIRARELAAQQSFLPGAGPAAGFTDIKTQGTGGNRIKGQTFGSIFFDTVEECDNNQCTIGCDAPTPEFPKGF